MKEWRNWPKLYTTKFKKNVIWLFMY